MFLKQCVEASPIVPIQQEWLDAMLMRVPPQLRQRPGHQELLEELCKEVSDNFMKGMVQHTGKQHHGMPAGLGPETHPGIFSSNWPHIVQSTSHFRSLSLWAVMGKR